MKPKNSSWFTHAAKQVSHAAGRPVTFMIAVGLILLWALSGPLFDFSDTWQLVINTSTTIITFLMVFLIQNTQNRDTEALQIKMDEIIRSLKGAENALIDLEELDDDELDQIRKDYLRIAKEARKTIKSNAAKSKSQK